MRLSALRFLAENATDRWAKTAENIATSDPFVMVPANALIALIDVAEAAKQVYYVYDNTDPLGEESTQMLALNRAIAALEKIE